MSHAARRLCVGEGDTGTRLDVFLAEQLGLSRAQVRRLLARGAVRLDGRASPAKGVTLRAGSRVEVEPFARPEERRALAAPEQPLEVLAQGPGWLALAKPAGVPVHPLEEEETGTLLNALIARYPEVHGIGEGGLRSGVVHRLDVDTSGALLWATRQDVWEALREAFRSHRVEKLYRAIVIGRLEQAGSVSLPLVMARHRPARVRVLGEEEAARTRGATRGELAWRPLEVGARASLVEVRLHTGFLHQIRVILAHLGFPVAGDRSYGALDDASGAPRQMLHAARVAWRDIAAECPEPPDFGELRRRLCARS
jgi:23S rRNA pseudouridine1911/1915/1917 synthase